MKKEKEIQDRTEVLFETISTVYCGKSSTTIGIYAHGRNLPSFFSVHTLSEAIVL
jgi:hypothetical protein